MLAQLYYQRNTGRQKDGFWLAPKKMHKILAWAGSFKMLLGQGRADYLATVRHPVPACISIYRITSYNVCYTKLLRRPPA